MQQTPASPAESSPLSTPRSDAGEDVSNVEEELLQADVNIQESFQTAPAKEDSQAQDFSCPHCGNPYTSERKREVSKPTGRHVQLLTYNQRHLKYKKGKCYKAREAANVGVHSWSCPRCKMRLSNISSAEVICTIGTHRSVLCLQQMQHHIKETCWKNCDQCCERGLAHGPSTCDAFGKEGNCSNCEEAGLACSKQTAQVADCFPERYPGVVTESGDAPDHTTDDAVAKRDKRKPAQSPENSPKSKPKAKRKTKTRPVKGDAAFTFDKANNDNGKFSSSFLRKILIPGAYEGKVL